MTVGKTPGPLDPETIMALKEFLDEAWARLRPEQQANVLKTTLAERIFRSAALGERDRERLLDAALEAMAPPDPGWHGRVGDLVAWAWNAGRPNSQGCSPAAWT